MVTVLLPGGEDWLSTNEPSRFSREFQLEALRRMGAGENVSVLARELGVSRKSISQWRSRYRLGGSDALRSQRGRMTKAEISAREEKPAAEKLSEKEARQTSLEELARAQRRIAALERKIDQQQVELDFQQALDGQHFRADSQGASIGDINARHGNEPGVRFYTHISDQFRSVPY